VFVGLPKSPFSIAAGLLPPLSVVVYHVTVLYSSRSGSWTGETAIGKLLALFAIVVAPMLLLASVSTFLAARRREPYLWVSVLGWPLFVISLVVLVLVRSRV
jgi:hypothetical protein